MGIRESSLACLMLLGCAVAGDDPEADSDDASPEDLVCSEVDDLELYERRIAPLLEDDRPSTCNQCHLTGVDLSLYLQATPCDTMACMVHEGIVDLESPESSLVLAWIDRATPSGGITAQSIATEHDAMLEWIQMVSSCGRELCGRVSDPCGKPPDETQCEFPPPVAEAMPLDDPGDCSDLTLELVWRQKVYSWRSRCYPCHFDSHDEEFDYAPPWIATGECNPASLATLRNAERAGYLDASDPAASLLLTKPLDESLGGVEHGGGPKIHNLAEPTYEDFAYFVQRWADCQ